MSTVMQEPPAAAETIVREQMRRPHRLDATGKLQTQR